MGVLQYHELVKKQHADIGIITVLRLGITQAKVALKPGINSTAVSPFTHFEFFQNLMQTLSPRPLSRFAEFEI